MRGFPVDMSRVARVNGWPHAASGPPYAASSRAGAAMCNLYSITKSQDAIRRVFGETRARVATLPPLPGIFPDNLAPVVRNARDGERELIMMRWGFPP